MAAQVSFESVPHQAMHMRPSAMLVGFAEMLALPSMELERTVVQELEDNPALERVEESACGFCGGRAAACPAGSAGAGGAGGGGPPPPRAPPPPRPPGPGPRRGARRPPPPP